ncbi:MAG TPA: hypothetical protein VJB65_00935, partial [Patescibacteria group bacterium]|nr:hypothetical protein [Patescibacteria group bacterium]
HAQTEHIKRPGIQDARYPGCSLLIADYLQKSYSLTAIIGAVRDQAERLVEDKKFFPAIQKTMKTYRVSFQFLLNLAKFIDAAFMVKDEKAMKDAIQLLRIDPRQSLTHKRLVECNERIQGELNRLHACPMDRISDTIYYQLIVSPFNITSEAGRLKSKQYPKQIVVIEQRRGRETSMYVRRWKYDLHLGKVVDFARSEGYICGGKSEVAGIVLPTSEAKTFRKVLFSYLKKMTHSS